MSYDTGVRDVVDLQARGLRAELCINMTTVTLLIHSSYHLPCLFLCNFPLPLLQLSPHLIFSFTTDMLFHLLPHPIFNFPQLLFHCLSLLSQQLFTLLLFLLKKTLLLLQQPACLGHMKFNEFCYQSDCYNILLQRRNFAFQVYSKVSG